MKKTHLELPFGHGTVFIVKSGWSNMYHVITENPEDGDLDYSHEFLSYEKVCLRYGLTTLDLDIQLGV